MEAQPVTASQARKMIRNMSDYHVNGKNPTLACYLKALPYLPDPDLLALFPIVEDIDREYSTEKVRKLGAAFYDSRAIKPFLRTHCTPAGSG